MRAGRWGGSLRIWRDYFLRSETICLDLIEKDVQLGRRVNLVQGDQSSAAALDKTRGPNGRALNIVIDDGSHHKDHWLGTRGLPRQGHMLQHRVGGAASARPFLWGSPTDPGPAVVRPRPHRFS